MLQRAFALGLVVLVASALAAPGFQDDNKGKAPYVKAVNQLQQQLSGHKGTGKGDSRPLSYVRIDEYRFLPGNKVSLKGRSLRPRDAVKTPLEDFVKQTLPGLLKKQDPKDDSQIDRVNLDDKNFFAPTTNPVHIDWQTSPKIAALDGVLILDAYFLADGTMQVLCLLDNDSQLDEVKAAVKAWEEKNITAEEKNLREKLGKVRETQYDSIALRAEKDDPSWTQRLRKHLQEAAKKGGEKATLLRQTRLGRISWEHDKNGKAKVVLRGVSIYQPPADSKIVATDTLQEELAPAIKDLLKNLRERVQAEQKEKANPVRERALELQPLSVDPVIEVKGIDVLAKDPVLALRESMSGVVLGGHQFDEDGVLRLSGIVGNKDQRKQVEKKVAESFKNPEIKVNADGMKELSEEKLPRLLQKVLAAADADPALRRTRLDRASFRYVKPDGKGEPQLQLQFQGVHLTADGLTEKEKQLPEKDQKELLQKRAKSTRETIQTALQKAAIRAIDAELSVTLPALAVVADGIVVSENSPRNDLQALVFDHKDLAGVRVREITFDSDGKLFIDIRGANDEQKKIVEKLTNDLKPLQGLLKKSADKDNGKVGRGRSETPRFKAVFVQASDTPAKPHDDVLRQLQQQLSADPVLSRTRIDRYGWKYDGAELKLFVNGVAVTPGDRLKEVSAKLIPLIEKAEGTKTNVTTATPGQFRINNTFPVLALQESSGKIADLNGVLITDVYYAPTGRLTVTALSPNAKRQQAQIKALVGERAGLPAEFVAAAPWAKDQAGTLALDIREPQSSKVKGKDWPDYLKELRAELSQGSRLERQTYVQSARFAYGKDEQTLALIVSGICLDPARDKNRIARILKIAVDPFISEYLKPDDEARVRPHHGRWTVDALMEFETPHIGLQKVVAQTPELDGVGISAAFFDKDGGLIFAGLWQESQQEKPLTGVTKAFLSEQGKTLKNAKFAFDCTALDTRQILRGLREYAADNLSEVWIARLFFDGDGTLTGQGIQADGKEYDSVRDELARLVRRHPKMKGHYKVDNLTSIATDAPQGVPLLDLKEKGPLAADLRQRYQGRTNKKRPPPSPRWDGILIKRGYYTPEGKFGLDGLCDSDAQREALNKDLLVLSKQTPFLDAFAVGVEVSKMRTMPLAPMIERLRLVMPAYPIFDGIHVDAANHDVDNKLILRVQVIGPEPSKEAAEALQKQILEHKQWWARAKEGLIWVEVGRPRNRDIRVGNALSRQAISELRKAMSDPKVSKVLCESMIGNGPWPAHFAKALEQATISLMHDPDSSATWFVRAMYYLIKNDPVRAARDLRRMEEIEMNEDRGPSQRDDRLQKTELLQGGIRKQLNLIQQQVAKNIKTGIGPITVAGNP